MAESKPFVIHEEDCELERWDNPSRGGVVWHTLLSSDRTPTDSLTMGVAELAPGQSGELHLHRHKPPEAYYIVSGTGVVSIAGTEYPIRAGSAVFIPGNAQHAVRNTGDTVMRLLYVFAADSFSNIEYHFDTTDSRE